MLEMLPAWTCSILFLGALGFAISTAARADVSVPGNAPARGSQPRTLVPVVASITRGTSRHPGDEVARSRSATLEVRANGDVLFDGEVRARLTPDTITGADGEVLTIARDGSVTRNIQTRQPDYREALVQPDGTVEGNGLHFAIHGATADFNYVSNCVANQVVRTEHLPPEAHWTAALLVLAWHKLPWRPRKGGVGLTIRCHTDTLIELHAN
jgi:hypothetical protein